MLPRRPPIPLRQLLELSLAILVAGCQPGAPIAHREPAPAPSGPAGHPPASAGSAATAPGARADPARSRAATQQLARAGETLSARLQHVQDGDSFVVRLPDQRRLTIRLSGIDAPERRQPYADVSRRHLQALLADRPLRLHPVKADPYGRLVARVDMLPAEGPPRDVSLAQLGAGLAWYFERYEQDLEPPLRSRYREAADAARSAGRGLWADRAPEPPWRYRARSATATPASRGN